MDAQIKPRLIPLGQLKTGARARIVSIGEGAGADGAGDGDGDDEARKLERRLMEMGFEENSEITLAHTGPVARDPMAVRVNGSLIALRRRDAMRIMVEPMEDNR